ncbi:MAG TPA: Gfo/Idh/MocA family oxidoreductase [Bacillota bacterium]
MQPINLGIIGTGIAARDLHWPALRRMPEKFTIKAVCNHTEEKAKEFSRMVGGVPYVTDYRQLLEMPEIDAVDITLPIELNYEVVKAAMQAGKDLIVEKPLAASLPQAEELVELEKDFARVAMVAEQFRYRSRFQRIKTLLGEGRIGEPEAVFWNGFTRTDPTNKYAQTKWRLHHQYPGGFVTDGGVHNVAALREILGEITVIGAFTKSFNPSIGQMDSISLQFTTSSRVSGVLNLFFGATGYTENRLIILGKKGAITLENDRLTVSGDNQTAMTEEFPDDLGFREELEDFYQSVRTGRPVKSSFKEAYLDLKVILHALAMAE